MNLIDRIQIQRAEEQLEAGRWKEKGIGDKGESLIVFPPGHCAICNMSMATRRNRKLRKLPSRMELCYRCRDEGWRGSRCRCGRPLHKRDYASNATAKGCHRDTACGICRAEAREFVDSTWGQDVERDPWNARYTG